MTHRGCGRLVLWLYASPESEALLMFQRIVRTPCFVLQGMWTRFFPAVEHARSLAAAGTLGDLVALHSDFGFNSTDVADYPDHLFYKLEMVSFNDCCSAHFPMLRYIHDAFICVNCKHAIALDVAAACMQY